MALELDPLIQRFTWDSSQFEAGLQKTQGQLQAFGAAMAKVGSGGAGGGGAQQLAKLGQAAQLTASHLIKAQTAVRDFAASQQGLASGQIQKVERSWFLTSREILGAQNRIREFSVAQQRAASQTATPEKQWGLTAAQIMRAQVAVEKFRDSQARAAAASVQVAPMFTGGIGTNLGPGRGLTASELGGAGRGVAAMQADIERAAKQAEAAQKSAATATQRHKTAVDSLVISLGGHEAVDMRVARAQQTLNAALAAGTINQTRYNEVLARARTHYADAETQAKGFRGVLQRLAPLMAGQAVASAVPGFGGFALGAAAATGIGGGGGGKGILAAASGIAALVAAAKGSIAIARAGDDIRSLQAQLESFLGSSDAARLAFDGIVNAATSTGTSLDANAVLFRRLAIAQEDLGASTDELIRFQTLVQQAIIASGAGAVEAAAGTQQLAQAMASGKLQGDEFRSVMENLPVLARQIAKGLYDIGKISEPTIGALNKMRESGKLLAEDVFEALLQQGTDIQIMFNAMPGTVERAATSMATNWKILASELDRATGASSFFQSTLNAMNEDLQETIEFVKTLGTTPANIDQKISDMQDKIALAQQSKSQFLDAPSAGGFGAELQGLAGDVSVLQGELNELVRLKGQFEMAREPQMRIAQQLATQGQPPSLLEPRDEREPPQSVEDILKRNQQTAGDFGKARDKADEEAHRKALSRIEERQDLEEKFQLEIARLSEKEDPLDANLETARIMQRLLRDLDFPPDAATVERMREVLHLAVLNAREAAAITEHWNETKKAVQDAMDAQAQRAHETRMTLPGVGLAEQRQIRESDLAFMQTPAAGPSQITARQAGQLRKRSEAELMQEELGKLSTDLQAVHSATMGSVDAISEWTVGLMTGTQTLAQFGDTMLDIASIIMRAVIQQTVAEPISNALIGGLSQVAESWAGQAAAPGATGLMGGAVPTTPGGVPINMLSGPGGAAAGPTPLFPGGIPRRQHGGPVAPGQWVVVGEHGPEFLRGGSGGGQVVPMGRSSGASAPIINIMNKSSGAQVASAKPRVAAGGGHVIDVMVADSVGRMAAGGGMDPLLRNAGVRRRGIARN